ncbi:MAG: hypothetical protein ABI851_03570 [Saprospiraceae bacterium]
MASPQVYVLGNSCAAHPLIALFNSQASLCAYNRPFAKLQGSKSILVQQDGLLQEHPSLQSKFASMQEITVTLSILGPFSKAEIFGD